MLNRLQHLLVIKGNEMLTIQRPGKESLDIDFILIDFEGTLATNYRVHPKAKDKINLLSKRTKIYIMTTGNKEDVEQVLKRVKAEVIYFNPGEVSKGKLELLERLGKDRIVAIGNGVDDGPILEAAGLGIAVIAREGATRDALEKADVVVTNILDALDLLLKPLRQRTTLGM